MTHYDVIVAGGGLLGCFALRGLARYGLKAALLERREDICTGISRANTAIVYSGCDTKPGTLKTDMCVRAARGFGGLCSDLGVRYSRTGSIMVCVGERGAKVLRKKFEQGTENGVRGMRLLTGREVLELEPNLSPNVRGGLFVPDTGTVMPWELCHAAAENAVKNGAEIILNTEIIKICRDGGGYKVSTSNGQFYAGGIINCAGLNAAALLEMVYEPVVRIVPSAGDYYVLDTKAGGYIKHVIFHEPEEKGKGLTLVPTVEGNILVGPTELPYTGEYTTSREGLQILRSLVSEVIPPLPMEQVIRSFGAVRPNPYSVYKTPEGDYETENKSVGDFCIVQSAQNPPFISLIGIKTPGLTCANELGLYVSDKMAEFLGGISLKSSFNPYRPAPLRLRDLSFYTRKQLVSENPAYGRVICRCEQITEGEIIDSIRRFPGAVTIDGVKRRAGAGFGRCQGGFCGQRVLELLARELRIKPEEVTKDGGESYVLLRRGVENDGI